MPGKTKKTKRLQTPAKRLKRMDCRRRAVLKHNTNAKLQEERETFNRQTDDEGNLLRPTPWETVKWMRFNSPDRIKKRRRYFKKLKETAGVN